MRAQRGGPFQSGDAGIDEQADPAAECSEGMDLLGRENLEAWRAERSPGL
jgi:hypothetical protein